MFPSTLDELCHEFGVSLTLLYKFITPTINTKPKLKKAIEKYVKEKS